MSQETQSEGNHNSGGRRKGRGGGGNREEKTVPQTDPSIEVLNLARSAKMTYNYDGSIFQVTRPFQMDWAKSDGPAIYGCCSGPMMIRMGARVADGIQLRFCTQRVYRPSGALIEGLGVTPDVPVAWSRSDWIAGRDPDLDAAILALKEKIQ